MCTPTELSRYRRTGETCLGGVANAFCELVVGVDAAEEGEEVLKSFTEVERDSCDGGLANAVSDLRPRTRDGVRGLCDMERWCPTSKLGYDDDDVNIVDICHRGRLGCICVISHCSSQLCLNLSLSQTSRQ